MKMMNRLLADALDAQTFVEKLQRTEHAASKGGPSESGPLLFETRRQRRARERAMAKAARKQMRAAA